MLKCCHVHRVTNDQCRQHFKVIKCPKRHVTKRYMFWSKNQTKFAMKVIQLGRGSSLSLSSYHT